jgi:hypothetical protein
LFIKEKVIKLNAVYVAEWDHEYKYQKSTVTDIGFECTSNSYTVSIRLLLSRLIKPKRYYPNTVKLGYYGTVNILSL